MSAICKPKELIWFYITEMKKKLSKASVFVPNSTRKAIIFFSKLNKQSELKSMGTKIDKQSNWICTKLNEWNIDLSVTVFCLLYVHLNTSYDCLRPEWKNTRAKLIMHLYQTLRTKGAQFVSKIYKQSEFISINTKIDEQSEWIFTKLNDWMGWFFGFGWLVIQSHPAPQHQFT